MENIEKAKALRKIASDEELMEVVRFAVENALVEFRDSRIFQIRNNGLVIKEKDGTNSHIIRMGMEEAMAIGLKAIADHFESKK